MAEAPSKAVQWWYSCNLSYAMKHQYALPLQVTWNHCAECDVFTVCVNFVERVPTQVCGLSIPILSLMQWYCPGTAMIGDEVQVCVLPVDSIEPLYVDCQECDVCMVCVTFSECDKFVEYVKLVECVPAQVCGGRYLRDMR